MSAGAHEPGRAMSAGVASGRRPLRVRALALRVPLARLSTVTLVLAGALPVLVYVWIALHRVGYPYELDWMEGGSVELVGRVLAGHSLFVAPSLRFVGWTYPPLYSWASAAVAELTGLGFLPLRLVSFASSLVSLGVLAWLVVRASGDRVAGLLAAGMFAAAYRLSGAWFDVGRVDSFFLALTLVALALAVSVRGARGGVLLGAVAFLAFFAKQSALVALLPPIGLLALTRPRAGVPALLTLLVLVLVSTLVLDALTDDWYRFYVVSELAGQAWVASAWLGFWRHDLLGHEWPLAVLVIAALLAAALSARGGGRGGARVAPRSSLGVRGAGRSALRSPLAVLLTGVAGLLLAAWVSRLHTGGYANVLLPAYAATGLLAGLACARLRRGGTALAALAAGLVALQIVLIAYPVGAQLPTTADRLAGAELLARLRTLPGPVLVLRHPWYATLAGKGSFAQGEAITDVLRSHAPRGARILRASLPHALDADGIQTVVLDGTFDTGLLQPELGREFRREPAPVTPRRLYPLTDTRTAPVLVYVRRRAPASGPSR